MPPSRFNLEGLFSRSQQGFFVLDDKRELAFMNPALAAMLADNTGAMSEEQIAAFLAVPTDLPPGSARSAVRPWGTERNPRWFEIVFVSLQAVGGASVGILGTVVRADAPSGAAKAADAVLPERLLRLRQENLERFGLGALPARSESMGRVLRQIQIAGGTIQPVALIGEAGVGKETAARIIHSLSTPGRAAFAMLDCRTVAYDLQREQLLGNASFDETPVAAGFLQGSEMSTLLVKHPFGLALELQERLIESCSPPNPTRLILAEYEPLEVGRDNGRLTERFFEWARALTIDLPPLRKRSAEFLDHCAWLLEDLGHPGFVLDPAAIAVMSAYDWPGNLYELRTVLEQAIKRNPQGPLTKSDLPRRMRKPPSAAEEGASSPPSVPPLDLLLETVERRMLELASARFGGNKSKAADFLKISRARFIRRWEQLVTKSTEKADERQEDDQGVTKTRNRERTKKAPNA